MFINKDLNAIFLHNPKCGGEYIREILSKQYGFEHIVNQETLHQNYDTFFDDPTQIKLNEDTDNHTIRKKGVYMYHLTHQEIIKRNLKKYFIFTFVRNPYERIFSAYNYLKAMLLISPKKDKIRNSYENKDYFDTFAKFVENRENVNNISFFHAFIPQYQQLMDDNEKINIHYIGRQENLDNNFLEILSILNVDGINHMNLVSMNKKINCSKNFVRLLSDVGEYEKSERCTKNTSEIVMENYTEDVFHYVNTHFEKDFELFGYKKYKTYDDFQKDYISDESYVSDSLNVKRSGLLKDLNVLCYNKQKMEKLLEKNEEILSILLTQIIEKSEDREYNEKILKDIETFNKKMKENFLTTNTDIQFIIKNMKEYVKESSEVSMCECCNNQFIAYNKLAKKVHCFFCK